MIEQCSVGVAVSTSALQAEDRRFESCTGHLLFVALHFHAQSGNPHQAILSRTYSHRSYLALLGNSAVTGPTEVKGFSHYSKQSGKCSEKRID